MKRRETALAPEVERRIRALAVELRQVRHGIDGLALQLAEEEEDSLAGIVRGRLECVLADLQRSIVDLQATADEEGAQEARP
jgi:hypothetical protein